MPTNDEYIKIIRNDLFKEQECIDAINDLFKYKKVNINSLKKAWKNATDDDIKELYKYNMSMYWPYIMLFYNSNFIPFKRNYELISDELSSIERKNYMNTLL